MFSSVERSTYTIRNIHSLAERRDAYIGAPDAVVLEERK
jgi:hypothetical protein